MASPLRPHAPAPLLPLLLLLVLLLPLHAAANLVLEDGYTVTTFADLNPHPGSASGPGPGPGPHPYALLPRPRAGDLVLLDSAGSALYVLPLGGQPPRGLAGGGRAGFDDGAPRDAAFDRPRSVAVDAADNVYVADRIHGAVRKVAPDGFTSTIAGGLSSGQGRRDGPAQNATFSPDFELAYVPKLCALLVADRGNRLIRQINLKPQDCAHETQQGLGTTSVSIIAIVCALLGSIIGFSIRHFYPVHGISIYHFFSRIQRQYKRTQKKATMISFCDIKSAVASSVAYTLLLKLVRASRGYLAVVFPSVRLQRGVHYKPSRLGLRKINATPKNGIHNKASLGCTKQLGDLISFDGDVGDSKEDNGNTGSLVGKQPSFDSDLMGLMDTPQGSVKKIDSMIEANLLGFSGHEDRLSLTVGSCSVSRRRLHGDSKVQRA